MHNKNKKIISRWIYFFLSLIMLSLMIPTNVFGSFPFYLADDDGFELLKGEKQFSLIFTYLEDTHEELKIQIKQDLTLKLQNIGVEPINWEFGISYLRVEVAVIKHKKTYYSGSIRVAFNKKAEFLEILDAFLEKGKTIHTYSVVWNEAIFFINANADKVKKHSIDLFDKFLNDYLKANPRKLIIEEHTPERNPLDPFMDKKSEESKP